MYLKAPTFLYHETLAPKGRVFQGAIDKPIPHPGEGWVDTPFPDPEQAPDKGVTDALVQSAAYLQEAQDEIVKLQEELSDMRARAESAEAAVEGAKAEAEREKAAHRETQKKLEEASAENDRLHAQIEEQGKELAKLPELQADSDALRRKKSGAL